MKVLSLFTITLLVSCSHRDHLGKRKIASETSCQSAMTAGSECFRIGDAWSKQELKDLKDLEHVPPKLHPALKGSVQFMLGGSGVLLGKFANKLVVASASHICEDNFGGPCPVFPLRGQFRFLKVPFKTTQVLGFWPEVDLMLLTIEVDPQDERKISEAGANFDFQSSLNYQTPLATAGYSLIANSSGELQMNMDSDCKILSRNGEVRYIRDPDQIKPDKVKKWAFAMGCDVAPGESGGPVIDRNTGKVLGLIWTGNSSTSGVSKSSAGLKNLSSGNNEGLWSEVSYSSAAPKIAGFLEEELKEPDTPHEIKALLHEILKD